jgi:oxalate decarboxylase/phosphoglucose isomerase-like protein (cupin superfamily)
MNHTESVVFDLQELTAQLKEVDVIRMGETARSLAAIRRVAPGQVKPAHVHPEADEWLVCLQGEGEYLIAEDQTLPIKAGQVGFAPGGSFHGIRNTGPGDLIYFFVVGQPY